MTPARRRLLLIASSVAVGIVTALGVAFVLLPWGGTAVDALRGSIHDDPPVLHWPAKHCAVAPPPTREVDPEQAFPLRCRETAHLKDANFSVTVDAVDYSPMQQRNGVELWPSSTFDLTLRCGTTVVKRTLPESGASVACGYRLDLVRLNGEDDATFTITAERAR